MSDVRAGQLLVATPALADPHFTETVVLVLDADDDGALGVVINRPSAVPVRDVLEAWSEVVAEPEVLFQGGPVSTEGALAVAVAADPEAPPVGWRSIAGDASSLGLLDLDTPRELVGEGLVGLRIFVGYAGWGAGQLEREIAEGSWYVVNGERLDVLRVEPTELRREVLRRQPGELAWVSTRPVDPDLN